MKLVDLVPLKEGSMQAKELADHNSVAQLRAMYDQLMRDMEQEAEPEGGPIADQYADQMHDIEAAMQIKSPFKKDSVGGMTYDQAISKKYGKSPKGAGPGGPIFEATEKSWNSIDVSRKAEKEIDNKEWNERTTKKLDMLIALNKAGKFKKDFDEERLQGWVDENYSWEKLARQFKLNESKNNKMEDKLITERFQELAGIKSLYELNDEDYRLEPEGMDDPDEDLVIIGSGYLDIKSNFGERPSQTNGEYAALGQKVVDQLHNGDKDAALDYIYSQINEVDEGSCGYSQEAPGGEELDTPGGTKGMDADTRTTSMMREVIRKEIKKLSEGGSLDDKLKGAFSPEEWDKITNKPVPSFADIKSKEKSSKAKKEMDKFLNKLITKHGTTDY